MDDDCEQQVPSVALLYTTVDNRGNEMTVVLGLPQLWSDAKLNRRTYLYIFYI